MLMSNVIESFTLIATHGRILNTIIEQVHDILVLITSASSKGSDEPDASDEPGASLEPLLLVWTYYGRIERLEPKY